jgi:hypothetical protein
MRPDASPSPIARTCPQAYGRSKNLKDDPRRRFRSRTRAPEQQQRGRKARRPQPKATSCPRAPSYPRSRLSLRLAERRRCPGLATDPAFRDTRTPDWPDPAARHRFRRYASQLRYRHYFTAVDLQERIHRTAHVLLTGMLPNPRFPWIQGNHPINCLTLGRRELQTVVAKDRTLPHAHSLWLSWQ